MSETSKLVREIVANALLTRNMALEEMAKVAVAKWGIDNCKLVEEMTSDGLTWRFEQIQPPSTRTPRPPLSLFEEVANLCDWVENTWMGSHKDKTISVRLALAAEKKRQADVGTAIQTLRKWHCEPRRFTLCTSSCKICNVLKALDAYEKGEAQ